LKETINADSDNFQRRRRGAGQDLDDRHRGFRQSDLVDVVAELRQIVCVKG
jgi:hypothetical protein